MEKVAKTFKYFAAASSIGLLSVILFFSCNQGKAIDDVRSNSFSEVISRTGWDNGKKKYAFYTSIDHWVSHTAKLILGENPEVVWNSRIFGNQTLVIATASSGNRQTIYRFSAGEKDDSVAFLDADAGAAYNVKLLKAANDLPFAVHHRLNLIDSLSNGSAAYRWEGCLVNKVDHPISEINLRSTLMVVGENGEAIVLRGNSRHATPRSGIPEILPPGEFFCTSLKSGNLSRSAAKGNVKNPMGAVEGHWIDRGGARRFACIHAETLNMLDYRGRAASARVVFADADNISSDENKATSWHGKIGLAAVTSRKGRNYVIRTPEGKSRSIKSDQIIALFPKTEVRIEDGLSGKLDTLARTMLSSDIQSAKGLFSGGPDFLDGERLEADLKRRFPLEKALKFSTIRLEILEAKPVGESLMVSYYVKAPIYDGTVWQTYDVIQCRKSESGWVFLVPEDPW